jgi:hypothetical protein
MTTPDDPAAPTWTDPAPTTPAATPVSTPVMSLPAAAVKPRTKSGAWLNILLGAAAVVAIGGVAFAIGRSTAPTATVSVGAFPNVTSGNGGVVVGPGGSFAPGDGAGPRGGFVGGFGSGGPTIEGTVTSIDGSTLTLSLDSGETMTVTLDGDTTYHEASPASQADVAVGEDVAVRVSLDGFGPGGANGGGGGGTAPQMTASDVTVSP